MIKKIKGTRDFYPADMKKRQYILGKTEEVLVSFGYQEYAAPILEPMELYAAKSSVEIIEKQSYTLTDRSGNTLVLRPELTPSLARMVAAKQNELPSLLRWYSFPDCWRYEAPQKGRLRNFIQINVDLLGSDSIEADAEIVDIGMKVLDRIGIDMNAIEVRINDRRLLCSLLTDLGINESIQNSVISIIDEKNKLSQEKYEEKLMALSVPLSTIKEMDTILSNPEKILAENPAAARLRETISQLTALPQSCRIIFDPGLARGFSYYTGIIFEYYDVSGDFKRAVCGGGRYDNLLSAVDGKPMSGVGFAVSDIVIETVLAEQKIETVIPEKISCSVIPYSNAEKTIATSIANTLRDAGIPTLTALPPYTMKKQLKIASEQNVTYVILLMPDEIKNKQVILRNMKTGEQCIVDVENIINSLI